MRQFIIIFSSIFFACNPPNSVEAISSKRDAWLWPFSTNSIWNTPIGDSAVYKAVEFEDAAHVGVDTQHLIKTDKDDPMIEVLENPTWGPGRCSGTQKLGFSLPIPNNWIVPDAGNSPFGNTPNSNVAILYPDGKTVFESSVIARCEAGGAVYLPEWTKYPDNRTYVKLTSDGLQGGGQGASGMSALGGTIRLGELINDLPIRHVIKINPWAAKLLHYSDEVPGWKWPAKSADNYAYRDYNRNADSDILMGSLFAIPPTLSPEEIGIQTKPGRKLFFTLQNYGTYFTEDAAWDVWDIIAEKGVEEEFETTYGFSMYSEIWRQEVNKLMGAVHVITNNTPKSIGGGGKPLQPLAPDFQ